jgi:hypothetical protein
LIHDHLVPLPILHNKFSNINGTTTLVITTLSKMALGITIKNATLSVTTLDTVVMSVIIPGVI